MFGKKKETQRQPIPPEHFGAITAAGSIYRVASYMDALNLTYLQQAWQYQVYDLYDIQGELHYAANYIGDALSRIKLVAARLPDKTEELTKPQIIPDGPVAEAVSQISSASAGQSGLLGEIGLNLFLVGECWLIAESLEGGLIQNWTAASISEIMPGGTGNSQFTLREAPGLYPRPIPDGALPIRIWKSHPRWSQLADASPRSCLTLLEKIVTLNRAELAAGRSRLAGAGILALPQELVPPGWQNQDRVSNPMESNPLWHAVAESMITPLKDQSDASAVVPLLLVGPGEQISKIKYEPMDRKFDGNGYQASIQNALVQIANTLQLPKEILLGMGSETTHWTAWAVREDVFQAHIQPLIELICGALTRTYLAQALGRLSPEQLKATTGTDDPNKVIIWYDASELIIRPDKGDKAIALHDRLVISDEALRRETGFPESDAPDEQERAERIGIKMVIPEMALTGELPDPAEIGRQVIEQSRNRAGQGGGNGSPKQ